MPTPFPGMDPYLEHQVLWTSVHVRLLVEMSKQLAPLLRPRYVASLEERVYIALPEHHRIPDLWVQKSPNPPRQKSSGGGAAVAVKQKTKSKAAKPVIVSLASLEVRERYIEILDLYQNQRVVTVIELVSPSNKRSGPGRSAYRQKQRATLKSECHLMEIDLLRKGRHVMAIPQAAARDKCEYDYLAGVNRWPDRRQFELYPVHLDEPLPTVAIPLAEPDEDVLLDLQAALEQVYEDGSYMLRVKYDEPCVPRLSPEDQQWAWDCWKTYQAARPELFVPEKGINKE